MYADVKLYHNNDSSSDCAAFQSDLDSLSTWAKAWRLNLNASKCKSIIFTLRSSPTGRLYTMEGQHMERCDQVRDLGVLLDAKLTFAAHVGATVTKTNRTFGMLIRSVQMPTCPRRVRFNHEALLSAFNAHVSSVTEDGSVIWSGAAITHLARFEWLQHRFLMWLASNTGNRCPSLE